MVSTNLLVQRDEGEDDLGMGHNILLSSQFIQVPSRKTNGLRAWERRVLSLKQLRDLLPEPLCLSRRAYDARSAEISNHVECMRRRSMSPLWRWFAQTRRGSESRLNIFV